VNEPAAHERFPREATTRTAPIRVAHVGAFIGSSASGVDRTLAGLVTHLDRCGVQAEVWHPSPRHRFISEHRSGSVRVTELPSFTRTKSAAIGLPASTREFVRSRRAEIDLLHLHSVFIPDNVWIARAAGLPYVVTPNGGYGPEVLHGRNRLAKTMWMWMRERRYVRSANLIHAVAPRELEQLRSTFRTDALRFAPNAVEPPADPVTPQLRMSVSPRRIVFLGRLAVQHKGLDLLVRGYSRYVAHHDDGETELIIAGPDDGSGRAQLEELAGPLVADGRVRFVGPVFGQDKDSLIRSARVFVHTSRWEGMPFAVLEALAAGCPVLLTPETNLSSFVDAAGAGMVVEGSVEGIAAGLKKLAAAPDDSYTAMCSAATRLAAEQFSWPSVAEQIARAYRAIMTER
jgi:glycosyltransferase involved in cell wall biosynthesis